MACQKEAYQKKSFKKNPNVVGCKKYNKVCCEAMISSCMACKEGISEKSFAKKSTCDWVQKI